MLWNNNNNIARVFLSVHKSSDVGKENTTMRRHSLEVSKLPNLELARSTEQTRRRANNKGKGKLLTPQETTFPGPDVVFNAVAREKKGMFAKFFQSRVSFLLD